ncbi:MAG: dTDP-4-dehydrorhamnose reductase [Desulfovibrionaceae bacterium]|nr:dTDP-4-dehydrorhamnose reductase [Desulfovibrionaceae bacterium]MBF0513121.1 dTDP-4-dehydrorhamnose reductase [Desulfovibrionaceae bacterium]
MSAARRALVLGGATGLVGQSLTRILREAGFDVLAASRADFNPASKDAVERAVDAFRPDFICNTVAYTAVDLAESEPDQAAALNKALPAMLGRLCRDKGVGLIHYSTDFVFDGKKNAPYLETDQPNPRSVYGKTKLAGERALLELALGNLYILRTAWLFGPGKNNFVSKILGLAKERPALNVVHDQRGSPTYSADLARYTLALIEAASPGLYHVVNSGRASWCELTAEAVAVAGLDCRVEAITTDKYPLPAKRPAYSVLDTAKFTAATGVTPRPWVQALRDYVYRDLNLGLE